LRDVLDHDCTHCFQFKHQQILDEEICEEHPQERAVLVVNSEWVVLNDAKPLPSQPVNQRVHVNLLHMPVPMESMNREARFPDGITEFIDRVCVHEFRFFGSD
jgi:hypothetical protein